MDYGHFMVMSAVAWSVVENYMYFSLLCHLNYPDG